MKALLCFMFAFTCDISENSVAPEILETHYDSAVILQYHHVSEETPESTSISPSQLEAHLDWLEQNDFLVLPLNSIIQQIKQEKPFNHSKVVAITFDDANISVCDTAWPILKKRNLPFTVFISTEALEKGYLSQCSWKDLKTMLDSGLVIIGNHTHRHLNMVKKFHQRNPADWEREMKQEIELAQDLIRKNLGVTPEFFAYPYGEYNKSLEALVEQAELVGFGQHSGAVGFHSDFLALPRFPASGRFANLKTLSTKLNSLAFPAKVISRSENPIAKNDKENPPVLELQLTREISKVNCFDSSSGEPINTKRNRLSVEAQSQKPLGEGRHRYNCTSPSEDPERFYWISYQWLIE